MFINYMISILLLLPVSSETTWEKWRERLRPTIGNPVTYGFYDKSGQVLKNETIQQTFNPLSGIFHTQATSQDAKVAVFSMSKVVSGFLALMTMEVFENLGIGEKFNPLTNVLTFAPNWKAVSNRTITVAECLTHMGGMGMDIYGYGISSWYKHINEDEIGKFNYGSGFDVVAYILPQIWKKEKIELNGEVISWEKLQDVAFHLLFQPLKMVNSEFYGFEKVITQTNFMEQAGGASLFTSVNDFSKFIVMLLNKGNQNPNLKFQLGSSTFKMDRYLSESHFEQWVFQNRLPFNESSGSFATKGLGDNSYGHSYIGAVCDKTRDSEMVKDFGLIRKYVTPNAKKNANTIMWRGVFGSAWEIDFEKEIAFVKITRNAETLFKRSMFLWMSMTEEQKTDLYGHVRMIPSAGFNHIMWTGNVADMMDNLVPNKLMRRSL